VIPLSDSRRRRRLPWVTWLLAAACLAVFVWELSLGARLAPVLERSAFAPADLGRVDGARAALAVAAALLLSLFLHGSLLHLAGNLAFLLVFGDDVEEDLGAAPYLAVYLGSGVAASLAHAAMEPGSELPLVGASGAIAGLLAVFLVRFPRARLAGVLPLGCLWLPARSRAWQFVPLWFLIQLAAAFVELGRVGAARPGVAWYAHLAGFAAGPPLALLLGRRRRLSRRRRS